MSDDDDWYSPNRKPPVRKVATVPGEVIWTITVDHIEWSCEFRFHGESYGWDVRLIRAGDFSGRSDSSCVSPPNGGRTNRSS